MIYRRRSASFARFTTIAALLCVAAICLALHLSGTPDGPSLASLSRADDDDVPADTETKVFEEIAGFSARPGRYYFNQSEGGIISVWWEGVGGSIMKPLWQEKLDCEPDCPHTFLWADFDGDGGKDLFVLSGDE